MNGLQDSPHPQDGSHPLSRSILRAGIGLLILGALALGTILMGQRRSLAREAEARRKAEEAGPQVRILALGGAGTLGDPIYQGEALPYLSTTLYARAAGFLREIRVDKGSRVRRGQVLAVIESLETDRDLAALRADAENKRRNAQRLANLLKDKLVSARDAEQAATDAHMAEAKFQSLGVTRGYQRLQAPFDGVVTQRFADPGALIQNASNSLSAQPVVTVAQVDRLRVTLYLDQTAAAKARLGDPVQVAAAEAGGPTRPAKLSRLAGALDPRTRTLTAEADLDNRDGAFLPGGSVRVTLGRPGSGGLVLPLEAVALRQGKPFAFVLDATNHVHLKPLQLGEDNGQRVHLLGGLQPGQKVVLSPPPTLADGAKVRPLQPPPVPAPKAPGK